jgi:crotonobetainyl-CoA:carnitine CoA-transferase CaiB-like acyl-CoA transferase
MEHNTALIEILDEVFAPATLDDWRDRLRTFSGVWDVNQTPQEVVDDPQAANALVASGGAGAGAHRGHLASTVRQRGDGHGAAARARPAHRGSPARARLLVGRSARAQEQGSII